MLARPSIEPDPESFLREMVVVTWRRAGRRRTGPLRRSPRKRTSWRDRFFFGLSRRFGWAKSLRWTLQKRVELGAGDARIVSRNNSMRPPLAPLEFLDYRSRRDTDIIQEYYVPVESFVPFMDRFRADPPRRRGERPELHRPLRDRRTPRRPWPMPRTAPPLPSSR